MIDLDSQETNNPLSSSTEVPIGLVRRDIPESLADAPVAHCGASGEDNSRGSWASTSLSYIYPSFRIQNDFPVSTGSILDTKKRR